MWSEYHRGQARTLAHLAQLTRDPNTAASLMRLAAKHAAMADRAESQKSDEAKSELGSLDCEIVCRREKRPADAIGAAEAACSFRAMMSSASAPRSHFECALAELAP